MDVDWFSDHEKITVRVNCENLGHNSHYCDTSPCINGKCIGGISTFYCQCDDNWKGRTCNETSKYTGKSYKITHVMKDKQRNISNDFRDESNFRKDLLKNLAPLF